MLACNSRRVGTSHFSANRDVLQTNLVAALAQCEAALEIVRAQNQGHLVTISSMSAMRGLPKQLSVYAASKRGLVRLTKGLRAEMMHTPIRVSCICPGYIRTDLNASAAKLPFEVDTLTGSRALVRAIESERALGYVPAWPWWLVGWAMRLLPLSMIRKMS